MLEFLAIATRSGSGAERLRRAASVTQTLLPGLGSDPEPSFCHLPEIGGGWFTLRPAGGPGSGFLSEAVDDELAVLCFGRGAALPASGLAGQVRAAWLAGGVERVQEIEASFAALVVDRRSGRLEAMTDLIGRYAIRHASDGDAVGVAIRDLPLVAAGVASPVVDPVSAATVVATDWPIGPRGLLESVRVCTASQSLAWRAGELRVRQQRATSLEHRLDARDRRGVRRVSVEMTEALRDRVGALAAEHDGEIRVEITAGQDSRAIFACALLAVGRDRLVAQTMGGPGSPDVRYGQLIARWAGVRHRILTPEGPRAEGFRDNLEVLAYFSNGWANAKDAFGRQRVFRSDAPLRLRGGGGEMYRGYYYTGLDRRRLARLSRDAVVRRLVKKIIVRDPFPDGGMRDAVAERIREGVDAVEIPGATNVDLFDLFHIRDRWARWTLSGRSLVNPSIHYAYESPGLVRRLLRLPAPMGLQCSMARDAVARALPGLRWLPVNRELLLPLFGRRQPGRRVMYALERLHGLGPPASHSAPQKLGQLRARLIGELLQRGLRDGLEGADTIATSLLGKDGITRMVDDVVSGRSRSLQDLGVLITLETWRNQVVEAHRLAGART